MDAAATSMGSRARNDAKTKTRTIRAPTAPSKVSSSTPGPVPLVLPADRASSPVTPPAQPAGVAFLIPSVSAGPGSVSVKLRGCR